MSFWNTSEGEELNESNVETSFEVSSNFDPIPDGTVVTAVITEAKWDEPENGSERYISLRWDVVEGEFKGRVVFHKVRVFDDSDKRKDKALRMLGAIDANAKGGLVKLGREPTEGDLTALINKPMGIRLRIWEMNGNIGNWVEAVASTNAMESKPSKPGQASKPGTASITPAMADDDIPF